MADQNTIDVGSDFYHRLTNRNEHQGDGKRTAFEFRDKYLQELDCKEAWEDESAYIVFDFSKVVRIGPSFANTAFAYFAKYASAKSIKKRIRFCNISKIHRIIIDLEIKEGFNGSNDLPMTEEPDQAEEDRKYKESQEAYRYIVKERIKHDEITHSAQSNMHDIALLVMSFSLLVLIMFTTSELLIYGYDVQLIASILFAISIVAMLCSFKASEKWYQQEVYDFEKILMHQDEGEDRPSPVGKLNIIGLVSFMAGLVVCLLGLGW